MLVNKRETINHELTHIKWDLMVGRENVATIGVRVPHDIPTIADAHITYSKFSVDAMRVTDDCFDEILAFLDGLGVDTLFAIAPDDGELNKWIRYVNFLGFAYMGESVLGIPYACMDVH